MRASTKRLLGVLGRGLPEAVDLGHGRVVLPRRDVGVHHGAVRRSVVGWADTQLRALASASARARAPRAATVELSSSVRPVAPEGQGERVGSDERVQRRGRGRAAQHRLHVIVARA
jgi:hypothetical protein